MVCSDGIFGERRRKGWELTADLAYLDYKGRFWLLEPGYVWDGPSYPDFLEWFVGKRNKEALLAASAFHDIMGPETSVFLPTERGHGITPKTVSISILEAAKLYRHMKRDWPDAEERAGVFSRIKQSIGLILFQRFFRLLNGGGDSVWRKCE